VLTGVLIAAEVNGIGDQKPGDTTTVDVQTLLEASEHILEIYLSKTFLVKRTEEYVQINYLKCWTIRSAIISGARFKEFYFIMEQRFKNK